MRIRLRSATAEHIKSHSITARTVDGTACHIVIDTRRFFFSVVRKYAQNDHVARYRARLGDMWVFMAIHWPNNRATLPAALSSQIFVLPLSLSLSVSLARADCGLMAEKLHCKLCDERAISNYLYRADHCFWPTYRGQTTFGYDLHLSIGKEKRFCRTTKTRLA